MCIIRNTEKTSKAVSERRVTKAAQELEQNKLPVLASFLARFWYTVFFLFWGEGEWDRSTDYSILPLKAKGVNARCEHGLLEQFLNLADLSLSMCFVFGGSMCAHCFSHSKRERPVRLWINCVVTCGW